jgi:Predicted aminoglycoside phosphotransferase
MATRIDQIVEATFGAGATVVGCEAAAGGRVAETHMLRLSGESAPERAVCKIGGPSVRTGDVIEPLIVALVAERTSLPVPAVCATGTIGSRRWALYEFRPGTPPEHGQLESAPSERIVHRVGTILGELHLIDRFDQVGGLARMDGQLMVRPPFRPWVPERLRRVLPTGTIGRPVVCHGDLFPGNLLVDGDRVTAVLDWGNAHVSTPGYALARAEMRFVDWFVPLAGERDRLRAALRTGYREHRPLPPAYETVAGLWKAAWLGQSAGRLARHTRTQRGRRQLRRHVKSLFR